MHAGAHRGTALSIARTAVGAMAVALALSACTGTPPSPPPETGASTTAPDPTPTPSPTPTVDLTVLPARPDAMSTPSADGAAAAATYFTHLYAYAYATGDLSEWKAMSEPDCQFCNSVIDDITSMVADGGSDSSAAIEVASANGLQIAPDAFYSATLKIHQGESTRLNSAGNVIAQGAAGDLETLFALAWRDGWFVRQVDTTALEPTPTP